MVVKIRKKKNAALDTGRLLKLKVGHMVLGDSLLPKIDPHQTALIVEDVTDDAKPGHRRITIGVYWHDVRVQDLKLFVPQGGVE